LAKREQGGNGFSLFPEDTIIPSSGKPRQLLTRDWREVGETKSPGSLLFLNFRSSYSTLKIQASLWFNIKFEKSLL
jgi:hypothetical protein